MCKASKRHSELVSFHDGIRKDLDLASKRVQEWDKKLSDHYHMIEVSKFDAARGYYLAKQLQDILKERREAKVEYARLNTFMQHLSPIKKVIDNAKKSIERNIKKQERYSVI